MLPGTRAVLGPLFGTALWLCCVLATCGERVESHRPLPHPRSARPPQVMVWGWDATTSGNYYPLCSVALDHALLSLLEQFAGAWTQRSLCKGHGAGVG